ncbi:MAG: tRNA lysidine(34) synthetase TilS [Rhodobacteraceae bacterium]|nr:MAG: tRNA lysidine(34) synthetase TilS [Paracoccaceae bacterium]
MHAAARWARARGVRLAVATVDHGLRAESAAEAAATVRAAASLGLPALALRWEGPKPTADVQAAARAARAALLSAWAARDGLSAVALGHTFDDQAETVLLRLARGSGVDGLSGMAEASRRAGAVWLRPMLGIRRAALRAWLAAEGVAWIEDPSNDALRFDRVRARRALAALAPLGLDAAGLVATAGRMACARRALEAQTEALAREAAVVGPCGEMRLAWAPLAAAEEEIALRLLSRALRTVSGAAYGPRAVSLARLWRALCGDGFRGATLHGCVIGRRRAGGLATLWVAREPAACARGRGDAPLWDGRWLLETDAPGETGPLGEAGLAALRAAARAGAWTPPAYWPRAPRAARLTTPALWRDGRLAAAPVAGYGEGMRATLADAMAGAR